MNEQQKLEVTQAGQYNNMRIKDLDEGNYIVAEKVYAEGYKVESKVYQNKDGTPSLSFACRVIYEGEEVSFWLNEEQHNAYKEIGGIGDTIRIIKTEEPWTDAKKVKRIREGFIFKREE